MCLGTAGVIIAVRDDEGVPMALVDTGAGAAVSACLLTCPEARAGSEVLVHSGYVLQILDDEGTPHEDPSGPRLGPRRRRY
jgi:hydrogenase maturation factor